MSKKQIKVDGIILEQRVDSNPIKCFTFVMEAEEAVKFCTVIRQADNYADGYQRRVNENKLKAIQKFMATNQNNIIPNNVIIAIGKELKSEIRDNTLTFEYSQEEGSDEKALIIDGQHRLYGLHKYSPDAQVLITALIDVDIVDQAFQFVVINNKSQSAKLIDVKAVINADSFKNKLSDRFIEVGIRYGNTSTVLDYFDKNKESPFFGLLDWDLNKHNRIVSLKAVEDIFRYTKNNIIQFKNEDDITILTFLNIIWTLIAEQFPEAWKNAIETKNKQSSLLKKSTIIALTEYIISQSKAAQRYAGFSFASFDSESIKTKILEQNIFKLPPEFFISPWKGGLDTSGGKELIIESVDQIVNNIDNGLEWNNDVNVLKI